MPFPLYDYVILNDFAYFDVEEINLTFSVMCCSKIGGELEIIFRKQKFN